MAHDSIVYAIVDVASVDALDASQKAALFAGVHQTEASARRNNDGTKMILKYRQEDGVPEGWTNLTLTEYDHTAIKNELLAAEWQQPSE